MKHLSNFRIFKSRYLGHVLIMLLWMQNSLPVSIFINLFFTLSMGLGGGHPVSNFMLKVNNRNTRIRCEIYSKLTIKTPQRRQ